MEKITLGGTDLNVSRICFGNMTFGGQTDERTAAAILDCCFANGINFIDTANVYNKGMAEEMLGRLMSGRRHRIVLATKVRGIMGPGPGESGLSRGAIERAIEESLRRLKTDYVDLYYLHAPDPAVPIEETLETMERLVQQGKVRYPASSNYAAWQVVQMRSLAASKGWRPVTAAQMMYNLVARGLEQEFVPMAKQFDVPLVVYNPLAGGLLTGKQKREAPLPGTRFDKNELYQGRYWHPQYFDAVDELSQIAQESGRSLVSLSLNWLWHHTATACVLLGASKLEQLEENLKTLDDGPLAGDVLERCDAVWGSFGG